MHKLIVTLFSLGALLGGIQASHAELKPEPIPAVAALTESYPDSWIFVHDVNFDSMIQGKIAIIDIAADSREYKGAIDAALMASFAESTTKPVMYVAESFYARGTMGTRTDVVSIYDKASLKKITEIILPNKNRAQMVSNKYMLQLVDDDRYLLVFAFTPAASVIVIDTETNELLNEISIAGCSMIYPTGERGFASLCGDGTMKAVQFDSEGMETERYNLDPFFSVDDDPLFDKPSYIGETAYFISYKGEVQPIDLSASEPEILAGWSLVSEQEKTENWRPGGWQLMTTDGESLLYIIMHKDGYNGSHKFGGEEIWVFDTASQQRVRRIELDTNAFSIELTHSETPLLAVTNVEMGLDVYSAEGDYLRFITVGNSAMPFVLHAGR